MDSDAVALMCGIAPAANAAGIRVGRRLPQASQT